MNETAQYRYPGIQPFTERQKELFFGREDDCENLLSLLLLEKLSVLFGKSGFGKSSLLNAGIAPALHRESERGKRQYIPVFVRFHSSLGQEHTGWFDRFAFQLARQMPADHSESEAPRDYLPKTLWGELKRRQTEGNQVFVLIFDQFEELFTYPPEQVELFKQQLADLLYADIPEYLEQYEDEHTPDEVTWMSRKLDARAVIAIRADRLSELDQLKDKLPAILNKRYELRALTREQAREALVKPAALERVGFRSPVFSWHREAIEKVLNELSHDKHGRETGVEAFQLQILAQNVEQRVLQGEIAVRNSKPEVTIGDLPATERLYEDFYEEALKKLTPADRKKTRRLIEQGLIFEQDNQRINLHEKLISRDYGVGTDLIQQLTDLRLLRAEPSSSGGRNIELSHDAFVHPILSAAQRRKQERWKKRATALAAFAGLLILLSAGYVFSLNSRKTDNRVLEQNTVLTQELDSLKTIKSQEEQAREQVLRYVECLNNHDVACLSSLSADTYEQYYRVENLPREQREKLERDYFRRHAGEKIAEVRELTVEKTDSIYDVTANTMYFYEKRGLTPVIFKIKLNPELKMFYLRSFIAAD